MKFYVVHTYTGREKRVKELLEKAIEPLHEARSALDMWSGLAARVGLGEQFRYTSRDYMRMLLDSGHPSVDGITFERLEAEKIVRYKEMDFVVDVEEWSGGKGVDVVLDTIGGEVFKRSMNVTRIGGKIVTLLANPLSAEDAQLARMRNLSICYEMMLTPQVMKQHEERIRQRKILEQGAKLIAEGKLGVLVSYALPLEEAAEAHRLIEKGGVLGKIILTM